DRRGETVRVWCPRRPSQTPHLSFRGFLLRLDELVGRRGVEIERVDLLQLTDLLQRFPSERCLPLERMKDDAFEEVAEAHVVILGEALEDFQDPLLQAHA